MKRPPWKYETSDSAPVVGITGTTPEITYDLRRAWLEARFIERCEARELDIAAINARDEAREALDRTCAELRQGSEPPGLGGLTGSMRAILLRAASTLAPGESWDRDLVRNWSDFLRDETSSYADYLLESGVGRAEAVTRFIQHVDEILSDLKGRRWNYWRARLYRPDREGRTLAIVLDAAAGSVKRRFEKRIWAGPVGPSIRPSVLPQCGSDEHGQLVAQIAAHVAGVKAGRVTGFRSKAAFYRSLQIDRADYYRWVRQDRLNAPGHKKIIEDAARRLPT